jgi:hypothetical protein
MDAMSAGDLGSAEPHLAVAVRYYRDIDYLDGLAALSALPWRAGTGTSPPGSSERLPRRATASG